MVNAYPDIAIRPDLAGYPLVNQQTSGGAASDAQDAAHFQGILDRLAAQAQAQTSTQASNQTPRANFALTKASGWAPAPATPTADSSSVAAANGNNSHSVKGFLKNVWDVVNPLQHIPVVGAIYRHATGDTISPGAHFIGDALYGGPIGGAIAAADIAYQKSTGRDMGETVIASLTGHGTPSPASGTMVAQNLTQITPAAGGATQNASVQAHAGKGIWSDNSNSSSATNSGGGKNIIWASQSPLFPPSGTIGEGSAPPSSAQPALQASSAASTSVSQTQEAPAGAARTAVPPELIVSRMMEGLQKYAQLKQQEQQDLNPQMSGLY